MSSEELYDDETLECANNVSSVISNVHDDPWLYIYCFRGPQTQDLRIAIVVTVVNSVLFVTGILGNLVVGLVILNDKSLHSPTNYYLLNLALSDVTLLIFGLPYDVSLFWYQYPWIFGNRFCQIRALVSEAASYVSVLTVVAFSTERYLAICHPLYKITISNLQRTKTIIICLWIISFFFAFPFSLYSTVDYVSYPVNSSNIIPESGFCAMTSQGKNIPLAEISTLLFFFIPIAVILYQFIEMGMVINKSMKENGLGLGLHGCIHGRNRNQQLNNKNVVIMLGLVVIGFFGCWFPFHAQRLVSVHLRSYEHYHVLNYWLYIITGVFYYLSSTLNPIIYNIMSDRMRKACKRIFCGAKQQETDRQQCFQTSTTRESRLSRLSDNTIKNENEKRRLVAGKNEKTMQYDSPETRDRVFYELTESIKGGSSSAGVSGTVETFL